MNKTIAEKCEKCGGLKAGDLHQFSSCAMEVISRLNARVKLLEALSNKQRREDVSATIDHIGRILDLEEQVVQLEARILMMSTIENNLRAGLKQLANPWVSVDDRLPVSEDIHCLVHYGTVIDPEIAYYAESVKAWDTWTVGWLDNVTHWMPIPPVSEGGS